MAIMQNNKKGRHMVKYLLIMVGIIVFTILLASIIIACINDDSEEIDNTNGNIVCGNTNEPCIKDKLYTKCNNCDGCPYNDKQ